MSFLQRLLEFRWLFVVLIISVLPFSIHGAIEAWKSNSNRVADWIPDDFEANKQLIQFVKLFGSDELLMISWEGCTLEDKRIAEYTAELSRPVIDGQPYFREVVTGPQILKLFESESVNISREEALQRMQGWIVSSDGQTTCLVARVSDAGFHDRHAAIDHAMKSADRVEGLSADSIFLAGPTLEGVAIDRASTDNLLEINLLSLLVCLAIMIFCLRSIRAAVVVFLLAIFNEHLALALVHACGTNMDSILMLTANLTFVLTISIGIHLVNYYRDAQAENTPVDAPASALLVAIKPTSIATLTTAMGLTSLTISRVKPLIRFGAFSSLSVLIAATVALVFVAAHFRIWPLRKRKIHSIEKTSHETFVARWMTILQRLHWPILMLALTALLLGFFGARRLRSTVGLRELLSPNTRVIQDYKWLEKKIGPLIPVEIVLEMPPTVEETRENEKKILKQFRTVAALHQALAKLNKEYAVISTATISPDPPPDRGGFRQIARAAVFRQKLLANQQQLSSLGYLRADEKSNHWRITMRAPAMQAVNYGDLLQRARATVAQVVNKEGAIQPKNILICGGVPTVYQVQEQLLKDLVNSFLLAFALICLVLMLMFRSVYCGLVCMIPNVLPSAVVFGVMGWWGLPIEVGAILTASAALGIAVDDSLHFITWFRRKMDDGGTIPQAVTFAYRRCGMAMLQTTLICSFGLVVFSVSKFAPIARFGWCMFTLLIIALVADLVVLPAILLSPLGRPFLPRNVRSDNPSPGEL